jgi:NADPH:quinone reductase-like Zn-dependent oxidoreductase
LIHGAAGGVGTALLQLGRLAGLEMYGTCSSRSAPAVSDLGCIPIDYEHRDFAEEIHRLASEGVDVVFDPIGGTHLWQSRKALRPGGRVVGYGLRSSLRGEGLASGRPGRRNILGIDPDLVAHVREDILEEIDGPMLQHGLKETHGEKLQVIPARFVDRPAKEILEKRFDEFRSAG